MSYCIHFSEQRSHSILSCLYFHVVFSGWIGLGDTMKGLLHRLGLVYIGVFSSSKKVSTWRHSLIFPFSSVESDFRYQANRCT